MERINRYSPEAYFVIVKVGVDYPSIFEVSFGGDSPDSATTLFHELTHAASTICYLKSYNCSRYFLAPGEEKEVGFLIEDKGFIFSGDQPSLPEGKEAFEYLSNPTRVDKIYLQDNNQDLYGTVDEINAYTKSVRIMRAFRHADPESTTTDSSHVTLSRQIYLLTLQIKNIQENYSSTWDLLKKNKTFAFFLKRLLAVADSEIRFAEEEGLTNTFSVSSDFAGKLDENLQLIEQNRYLLDELFTATGVKDLEGLDLTPQELKQRGINLIVIKQ